jgi:tetratricopeptide (TPR) repeat protein
MAATEAFVGCIKKELIVTGILTSIIFFANVAYSQEPCRHVASADSKYEILFTHGIDAQIKDKDQFLLLASLGQKFSVEGKYNESNQYFEKAYLLLMDHPGNRFNGKVEFYDDDHDLFMVLYFKAINYLSLGLAEEALVECRRMDEWLRESNQNHHQARQFVARDPLVYVVMGLIYEVGGEFDNSLISYNQAKQLYQQRYSVRKFLYSWSGTLVMFHL